MISWYIGASLRGRPSAGSKESAPVGQTFLSVLFRVEMEQAGMPVLRRAPAMNVPRTKPKRRR
jgi:hypothetical protein